MLILCQYIGLTNLRVEASHEHPSTPSSEYLGLDLLGEEGYFPLAQV